LRGAAQRFLAPGPPIKAKISDVRGGATQPNKQRFEFICDQTNNKQTSNK
jgi:hypothetical protein